MTERQNTLIKELEDSFNRLNASNSGSFNLIDTNAITASLDVADTLKAEITAFNASFKELLAEQAKTAYNAIKDDIESLGLAIAIIRDTTVRVGRVMSENGVPCGGHVDFDFKASKSIQHTLIAPNTITQWIDPIVYLVDGDSYGFNKVNCDTFEPLLREKGFINKITRLVSRKKCMA